MDTGLSFLPDNGKIFIKDTIENISLGIIYPDRTVKMNYKTTDRKMDVIRYYASFLNNHSLGNKILNPSFSELFHEDMFRTGDIPHKNVSGLDVHYYTLLFNLDSFIKNRDELFIRLTNKCDDFTPIETFCDTGVFFSRKLHCSLTYVEKVIPVQQVVFYDDDTLFEQELKRSVRFYFEEYQNIKSAGS